VPGEASTPDVNPFRSAPSLVSSIRSHVVEFEPLRGTLFGERTMTVSKLPSSVPVA
jgi:hypothetical protein